MRGEKTRNGNTWTQARFNSFIKSALRGASGRWGPIWAAKKAARRGYGVYECSGFLRKPHQVTATLPPEEGKKRRINNAVVDHINPIVPTDVGFTTWDAVIERMFVELDGLQVLCHECHKLKTDSEKQERKKNKT